MGVSDVETMGDDEMKTYTTRQVIRLLELHSDWEFKAPETDSKLEIRAEYLTRWGGYWAFSKLNCGTWEPESQPDNRTDWVRTNPKPKRERIKVGEASVLGSDVLLKNVKEFCELKSGRYDLLAVRR